MNKTLANRILAVVLSIVLLSAAAGCAGPAETAPAPEAVPGRIDLNDPNSVPAGVSYDDGVFTLTSAGDYTVGGTLEGRLIVDADGPVTLVFDGACLIGQNCLTVRSGDPVTILGTAGTVNVFTDVLPDPSSGEAASAEATAEAPEESAAEETEDDSETGEESDTSGQVITSKAPLLFAVGSFTVNANVNNGIRAKDGLAVQAADLTVTAAHHGVVARGSMTVLGGSLHVTAGADAVCVKAERSGTAAAELLGGHVFLTAGGRGIDAEGHVAVSGGSLTVVSENDAVRADTIAVSGGELSIDAQCDGLQAAADLTVSGGTLSVTTGGGGGSAINHAGESFGPWAQSTAAEESSSAKGLKSDGSITVAGGELTLNTADDSIHCGTLFTMDSGIVTICSSDDAIHSDDWLVIHDGTLRIDDCFEGLEAYAVEVQGGDVVIRAVNDGINANGQEMMFQRSSDTESESTSLSGASTCYVLLAGGKVDLVVTGSTMNQGDGVDSNGAVYITGGEHIISTFGSFMENGLDTGWGGPVVTGGKVIAGGSSAMAEGFSSYSTQCCAVVSTSYMPDGTEVVLSDAEGNVLWDVVLADGFSCLQISHPAMQVGMVYTLTYGNQSTTLDFTNTNNIENSRGFGFRPF